MCKNSLVHVPASPNKLNHHVVLTWTNKYNNNKEYSDREIV